MAYFIRAVFVILVMLCLPGLAAAERSAPLDDGPNQAVNTVLLQPTNDDGIGASDSTPLVITVAPGTAVSSPSLRRQSASQPRRRDSLWNGVLLGAGAGALLGAVGGHALLDCSTCSAGFNVSLTFGVIGAGAGAGIGAGIDALRHTRAPIPGALGPITVKPRLGRGQRAVVMLIRF
jgi:hypothetical protein